MCGRLRVGKDFPHVCSIGRCSHVFGLFSAVHLTAGHNALRGSGPGHNRAFDNAVAQVGWRNEAEKIKAALEKVGAAVEIKWP